MNTSATRQLKLLPSQAQEVIARAHRREDLRYAATQPVDYKKLNEMVRRQRAALTRAVNSGDRDRVVLACRDAVNEWNQPGCMWPDEWARWQCALDDVLPFHQQISLAELAD